MTDLITAERADRVLTLRFNRADKKNALTQAMYTALADHVLAARDDNDIRALLFLGAPGAFSAGNDLQEFLQVKHADFHDTPVGRFMVALADVPKPVVAAVDGVAIGIGLTLLLHSDLVYASPRAKLQAPFVNIGICAEFASSLLLPRIMGHVRAAEILLLGEPIDAAKALEYGLVNAVLPEDQLEAHARARAGKLAQQPPNAVRITKQLMKRWTKPEVDAALPLEGENFIRMLREPEALEALTAFAQKRKPDFSKFV